MKNSEDIKINEKSAIQFICEERKRSITSGITTTYEFKLENKGKEKDTVNLKMHLIYSTSKGDECPEWVVRLNYGREVWEVSRTKILEREFELKAGGSKDLALEIKSPRGARYGDKLTVMITGTSRNDPVLSDSLTIATTAKQTLLAVKTSIGHEKSVADSIASRAKDTDVFSILSPATLRGYLLLEAMNSDRLQDIVKGLRRARGVVEGMTTMDEISHFLTPKPLVSSISEGDIVELIAGPFKGEKARVRQIDESKEEITVELFETVVPIPVTVRGDSVRVLEREK